MYGQQEKMNGSGRDMLCFVLGLLSFLSCSCLMPLAPILGGFAVTLAVLWRRSGGEWNWQACFGIALGLLGLLFGIFLTALLIYVVITRDPDSVYGIIGIFSK